MATKKKHNENAEWINNITRELDGLEAGPKTEIHRFTQDNTEKNIELENASPWWNTWFLVQEIYLHSQQTRRASTWMDDQRKDYIDPKGPKQRNCSKQLLLANKLRIVPWRTERMPQRIQMHSRITLPRWIHLKWEQDETEKSTYGLD